MHLARERLEAMGVTTAVALESSSFADGDRAVVAGVVTHRQHPETARGAVFVNLEDETGHVNVVFSRGAWARWKHVARHSAVLLIRGRVRKGQGAVSFDAERVAAAPLVQHVLYGLTGSCKHRSGRPEHGSVH